MHKATAEFQESSIIIIIVTTSAEVVFRVIMALFSRPNILESKQRSEVELKA